jgi:hypothetical protein
MNFLFSLAASFSVCITAHATDWKGIAELSDQSGRTYLDVSSVVQEGLYRKAWIMWDYVQLQHLNDSATAIYMSNKTLTYFDCNKRKVEYVQTSYFKVPHGDGSPVASPSRQFDPADLANVVSGSMDDIHLKFVCDISLKGP